MDISLTSIRKLLKLDKPSVHPRRRCARHDVTPNRDKRSGNARYSQRLQRLVRNEALSDAA